MPSSSSLKNPRKVDSFDLGWELVTQLVVPAMRERREVSGHQKSVTEKIDMFIRISDKKTVAVPEVDVDNGEEDARGAHRLRG